MLEMAAIAVLRRYGAQNGGEASVDAVVLARRLQELVEERGLPPPLAQSEMGVPGEMTPEEVASLVARLLTGLEHADALTNPVRQLVKACFQPEFRKCRDSYREVSPDGSCRRQQLARARERVSGSHCVDCPYWTELTPEQHEQFLAKQWRAGAADFAANREVFLPEDFRALRRCVRKMTRRDSVT